MLFLRYAEKYTQSLVLLVFLVLVIGHKGLDSDPRPKKIISFVIERTWQQGNRYGDGGFCASGGMNHAQKLLSAFQTISQVVNSSRRTVVLRPSYIFTSNHGEIPPTVKWKDMFRWQVDDDEFKSPNDVWRLLKDQPERFDVFDIHKEPDKILSKIQASNAEVVLLHMFVFFVYFGVFLFLDLTIALMWSCISKKVRYQRQEQKKYYCLYFLCPVRADTKKHSKGY